MINTTKGNKKNGVKTLAILLIFALVFQVETPILFSAVSRIAQPIKRASTITPLTSTITPISTSDTVTPVATTTEFFSATPITQINPIQTTQTVQVVDLSAPIGTVSTVISADDGTTTILPIQQISLNTVTTIQPVDTTAAIGSVSTTITADDGTTTVLPIQQGFSPATDTSSDPLVFNNTTRTTNVFDIRPEQEGTFPNEDVNAIVPEDDEFFTPNVNTSDNDTDDTSDNNTDNDSNDDAPPNPPVTPTTTSNTNPFVPTPQSNTGGGGSSSSGGVTLGDGRTPQPTVLNTKLSDFVGGGVVSISEKLAEFFEDQIGILEKLDKFLGFQKNKNKKNKKKKIAQSKEDGDEQETQSEREESTMTLVVDGQEIEVQKGQNAELKAKEALRPILKAIQKDSLGNDLKIDVVQDITSVFSFQSNTLNVVSKPQSQKPSIRTINEAKQTFIPSRQLKTVRLAKRIPLPLQFHKIHKLHTIATQEGSFINEFNTGADPDHAFPGE